MLVQHFHCTLTHALRYVVQIPSKQLRATHSLLMSVYSRIFVEHAWCQTRTEDREWCGWIPVVLTEGQVRAVEALCGA